MRVKLNCFNSFGTINSKATQLLTSSCIRHAGSRLCFLWIAIVVSFMLGSSVQARGFEFENHDSCDLLLKQATRDRWALLEYRLDPTGQPQPAVEVPHSSDASFAHQLLTCVDRGKARLPGRAGGAYKVLRFAPARGQKSGESGRQLQFELPRDLQLKFGDPSFAGYVALRVEMNEFGMIRSKDLLFSSNARLGEALLGTLDESLKVTARGKEHGPYTDILYLRFENGILINFSQSHFVDQMRLASVRSAR